MRAALLSMAFRMGDTEHPTIYFVLGEESGDALGADLADHIHEQTGGKARIIGLAGPRLAQRGVTSLFELDDIAVMGFTAVAGRLPTIVRRVRQTVRDILKANPDVVVLIDSPDFTHAVARRVRRARPDIPVVNYVCPSVWAWRPGRARAMRAYVDHVLTLLPFEPQVLKDLDGPPGTYVGHPLAENLPPISELDEGVPKLMLLPGSRGGEIKRILPLLERTVDVLKHRGKVSFDPVVIAVDRHRDTIETQVGKWKHPASIVTGSDNRQTLQTASAALACSGTVALELAIHGVPTSVIYTTDIITRRLGAFITAWTAVLPNLILDRVVVPEDIDNMARPERLARRIESLLVPGAARSIQTDAFNELRQIMATDRPAGEIAAEIVLSAARKI